MKFSVHMHSLHSIDEYVALAERAEEMGMSGVRIAERIDHPYPTWPSLFMMAKATQRVSLATSVTNPYSRHPAVTAKMIAFLDNYSEGRAILGIGQGDLWQFSQLGIRPQKPIRALRESIQLIRHFLAGNKAAFEGEDFSVAEGFDFPFRPYADDIPIFVGSRSPGGMTVAGELADELHLPNCAASQLVVEAQKYLKKGMEKVGREGDLVSLAASPQFCISQHRETAIQHAQREIGRFIAWQKYPLQLMGIELEETEHLSDAYRNGDMDYLYKNVNERYLKAFAVAGTPHDVIEQIERMDDMGVKHITFAEPGPDVEEALNLLEKEVLPHFAN